jgi:serine/threonine protein kinase
VAVKIIDRKETGADVQTVTDKEIEIMLAIDHKNCVTLLEIYQTDDQVQLVMEFLQGGDLFDHILSSKK